MECVKYVLVFSQFRSANFEIKTKLNIPFHHTPHQKMGKQTFKNYAMEIEQQQKNRLFCVSHGETSTLFSNRNSHISLYHRNYCDSIIAIDLLLLN